MTTQRSQTSPASRDDSARAAWGAVDSRAPRGQLGPEGFSLVGRYGICEQISSGGMASIHLGFLMGTAGFSRFVALKRMHAELSHDAAFAARFKHEVLLGAQIRHPNVVPALDLIEWHGELLLVMEFVHGENLAGLLQAAVECGEHLPLDVTLGVIAPALHGLHAAHEAIDVNGTPLQLVHRDFSPQNLLVGSDGHARVLDFGVAKSSSQTVVTRVGHIAGKVPYMAPEQLRGEHIDRRADIFSVGVVLWEALTGVSLFGETDCPATTLAVLTRPIPAPSKIRPEIPEAVDRVVMKALNRDPGNRYGSAREFALELERSSVVGGPTAVSRCVQRFCAARLNQLAEQQARAATALHSARQLAIREEGHLSLEDAAADVDVPPFPESSSRTAAVVDIVHAPAVRSWPTAAAVTLALAASGLLFAWAGSSWRNLATGREPIAGDQPIALSTVKASDVVPSETEPDSLRTTSIEQAAEPAAASVAPASQLGASHARPAASAARPAPKSSCAPPIYLDERGIRHFKPQCL